MVKVKPIRFTLDLAARLFTGGRSRGWKTVGMRSGRGAAKGYAMLDGTMSDVCISRGFAAIYEKPSAGRDYRVSKPMHILLKVSYENLSRFYPSESAREILLAYNRMNG